MEKVTYTGGEAIQRDIANLKAAMEAAGVEEGFLPVVAPASCFPNLIDEHYGSEAAALMGIAEALREEYKAIVDAGLYVQIDDAYIPFMYDVIVPPGTMEDYHAWAQPRIDALNHALEGIPADRVRYHVCWGTWNGPHTNDIALRDILGLVFQVNAGTYLYEDANPRHEHEWRVWEDIKVPDGKMLAPGVISHATNVRRAPGAGGRATGAHRPAGRAGERPRQHRLRVRAGPVHPPRAPVDPVGEAQRPLRGRQARLRSPYGMVVDNVNVSCLE